MLYLSFKNPFSSKLVAAALEGKGPAGGKGSGGLSAAGTLQKDFRVELAKTGASKCRICEDKIAKASCDFPL